MGTVEPITQVEVGSEISGTVTAVNVTYNDQVAAQQVLAEIGTDQLNDQAKRTKSLLNSARASVIDREATLQAARDDVFSTYPEPVKPVNTGTPHPCLKPVLRPCLC